MKKLPDSIPSMLGPVDILQGPETDRLLARLKECGNFKMDSREIRVSRQMPECVQHATLGHEIVHVIFEDSGLTHVIDEKLQEAVCDAFGAWFALAISSGKLLWKTSKVHSEPT